MTRRARWILIVCAIIVLVPVISLSLFTAWQIRRDKALLSFCRAVHTGVSLGDLLALEEHYSVDDSYLIQARFKGYVDQAHSKELEFRSQWFDPDFACAIDHDGRLVTNVQLLTLEGFKPE